MNFVSYILAGTLALSLAFFGGYRYATSEYQAASFKQQQEVAAAVLAKQKALDEKAVILGQLVEARRARGEEIQQGIIDAIGALPKVTNDRCEITPDAIRLLNKAGHQ